MTVNGWVGGPGRGEGVAGVGWGGEGRLFGTFAELQVC
jgi:hypothetical protein